jgi:phosphoribosylanthranilate isomerase
MITQIYEIQTPIEAEKCIEAGVDHIGSVILSKEEWKIKELKETVSLTKSTLAKSSIIPLLRDLSIISRLIDYYEPDFLHFCDSLTGPGGGKINVDIFIEIQYELKSQFPDLKIIRSIPIPPENISEFPTLKIASKFESVSDLFLTDTFIANEPVEGYIGITGMTCSRDIARDLIEQCEIPVILAGGLSPENVYETIMGVKPWGVDSCTQTNSREATGESIRFQKDFSKVRKFVQEVRRAQKDLLKEEIINLKDKLRDRETALPAHSVQPHQIQAIEELEDEITSKEKLLSSLDNG